MADQEGLCQLLASHLRDHWYVLCTGPPPCAWPSPPPRFLARLGPLVRLCRVVSPSPLTPPSPLHTPSLHLTCVTRPLVARAPAPSPWASSPRVTVLTARECVDPVAAVASVTEALHRAAGVFAAPPKRLDRRLKRPKVVRPLPKPSRALPSRPTLCAGDRPPVPSSSDDDTDSSDGDGGSDDGAAEGGPARGAKRGSGGVPARVGAPPGNFAVIIIPDSQAVTPAVMEAVVVAASHTGIPFCLLLGVCTTLEAFHSHLTLKTTARLAMKRLYLEVRAVTRLQ
jgi:hypothetical protein